LFLRKTLTTTTARAQKKQKNVQACAIWESLISALHTFWWLDGRLTSSSSSFGLVFGSRLRSLLVQLLVGWLRQDDQCIRRHWVAERHGEHQGHAPPQHSACLTRLPCLLGLPTGGARHPTHSNQPNPNPPEMKCGLMMCPERWSNFPENLTTARWIS